LLAEKLGNSPRALDGETERHESPLLRHQRNTSPKKVSVVSTEGMKSESLAPDRLL